MFFFVGVLFICMVLVFPNICKIVRAMRILDITLVPNVQNAFTNL